MSDAAWALQTARGVGPISPPQPRATAMNREDVGNALDTAQHEHNIARDSEKQFGALADTTRHEAPYSS